MTPQEIERFSAPLIKALKEYETRHSHPKSQRMHFSRWTQAYDDIVERWVPITHETIHVPCANPIIAASPPKVEVDRTDSAIRLIASRCLHCSGPSVLNAPNPFLAYAARAISDTEWNAMIR